AFAISSGLAPAGATKRSHPRERDMCKTVVLGINYGQTASGVSQQLGIDLGEAHRLVQRHEQTYPVFHTWRQRLINGLAVPKTYYTRMKWPVWAGDLEPRTMMNVPMQSGGSDLLRAAVIAGTEAGIEICATAHDALLIVAPLERLDADIATM